MAIKVVALLLLWQQLILASGALNAAERQQVCKTSTQVKCIWMNDYLYKPRGFPIRGEAKDEVTKQTIYCYDGSFWNVQPNPVIRIWDYLIITMTTSQHEDLRVVLGNGSQAILSDNEEASFPVHISPFSTQCISITSHKHTIEYSISAKLELKVVFPALLIAGCVLLFSARKISRNVPLLYSAGVVIGILGSALILLYFMSRFLPMRNCAGLGILAGGYSAVVYLLYAVVPQMLMEYWQIAVGYTVIAGLISFAIIYRWGGVSNPRTLDIVCWSLQLFGSSLVFFSSPEVYVRIVILTLVLLTYFIPLRYNPLLLPMVLVFYAFTCFYQLQLFKPSPPPIRLLTIEEYEEQGRVETAKAIDKLRDDFHDSPEIIHRLRHAQGFARFLSGADHIPQEEVVDHNWTFMEDSDMEEEDCDEDGINVSSFSAPHSSSSHSH